MTAPLALRAALARRARVAQHEAPGGSMPTRLTIRFDFDAGRRLGPGKVALLESIAETGSISAAGRQHAMSYRRAWLLVEQLNRIFGEVLVTARPGGAGGGGAALTPAGERVVALYREAERKMRAAAAKEIAGIEKALSREAPESSPAKTAAPASRLAASRSRLGARRA
jgi:molybdate transport system regulatory protein